jgi:hypothetical protein
MKTGASQPYLFPVEVSFASTLVIRFNFRLGTEDMPAKIELESLLVADDGFPIRPDQFVDDRAIEAGGMDADLRAGIAAQHGAILHEGHIKSKPCGRNCCRAAGDAAADHDDVELFLLRRHIRQPEQVAGARWLVPPQHPGAEHWDPS